MKENKYGNHVTGLSEDKYVSICKNVFNVILIYDISNKSTEYTLNKLNS